MGRKSHHPPDRLELLTLGHVGVLLLGATWMLGGSPPWARHLLSQWGSLSPLLTVAAFLRGGERRNLRPLLWLIPFALFNGLVLWSCRTPSYRELHFGATPVLVQLPSLPNWPPNTVRPSDSIRGLWLFDAVYLSCFNLLLLIRRRRTLRGFLLFAAANGLVLAVFGTLQHFSDATGPFFSHAPTRQSYFFASFIYHNHWGAFALLMTALCLGLMWHYVQRTGTGNIYQTPALAALLAVLLLAVTEPLSQSRSCMALVGPLLLAAFLQWLNRLVRHRRQLHESVAVPIAGSCVAAAVALAASWYVAAADIAARLANTRQQLVATHASTGAITPQALWLFLQNRFTVYRDVWHMAKDKLWFGWGMDSFVTVFRQYNTQLFSPVDHLESTYADAHNDWLQSAAEHGLVGSALLALCVLAPLVGAWRRELGRVLPLYLIAGCGLILLYAWFEFPFGNPGVVVTWWLLFFSALQYGRLRPASGAGAGSPPAPAAGR
jgi:O-antigen ligase